ISEAPVNPPLTFALRNVDSTHERLAGLKLASKTVAHFEMGYYSGRGMMKDHIVIPIHNVGGDLVAYAGIRPDQENSTYLYPPRFHKALEIYNLHRVLGTESFAQAGLWITPYPLDVLVLFELGHANVVSIMDTDIDEVQISTLASVLGDSGQARLLLTKSQDSLRCWATLATRVYSRVIFLEKPLIEMERAEAQTFIEQRL
ncbi:MAG: hypothetical protein GY757_60510, partial [bacterium]|nr:hypothetical protein [bacterium]